MKKGPLASIVEAANGYFPAIDAMREGFIVFNEERVHEVHHLDARMTRTVTHFPNDATREKIAFEGIFVLKEPGLERIPRTKLEENFPLNIGETREFIFDVSYDDVAPSVERIELTAAKKGYRRVGSTRVDVVEYEHRLAFDGKDLTFTHVEIYSPMLKHVLGMRISKHGEVTAKPSFAPIAKLPELLQVLHSGA